jgi:hypothetical protein
MSKEGTAMLDQLNEALDIAQTVMWDIQEMESMEMDVTAERVEYTALIDYANMIDDMLYEAQIRG